MSGTENRNREYGVRGSLETDSHGEIDAWLERVGEIFDHADRWAIGGRIGMRIDWVVDGLVISILEYGGTGRITWKWPLEALPKDFKQFLGQINNFLWSSGRDLFKNDGDLLKYAKELAEEGLEREGLLKEIMDCHQTIFENEDSRKTAEGIIFQNWVRALERQGWIRSANEIENLARLPILKDGEVLLYHGSPRYYPRYYRVWEEEDGIRLERIEATELAGINSSETKRVPLKWLETEELRIVSEMLKGISLGVWDMEGEDDDE